MPKKSSEEIIPILRKLATALNEEMGYSEQDLARAKSLATKLYVMHTNREISLKSDDFQMILDIIGFDNFKPNDNPEFGDYSEK